MKKKLRPGHVTLHLDEVNALAFYIGCDIGKLIEGSFDLAPIVSVSPAGDEPLEVSDTCPDFQPPATVLCLQSSACTFALMVASRRVRGVYRAARNHGVLPT